MPGVDGLTALPEIARNAPGATIVVFSEAIGDEEAALERGAHAVVHKSDSLELLVRVLKGSASSGGSSVSDREPEPGLESTAAEVRRLIIETMSEGLLALDQDGRVVDTNPAGLRILGRTAREVHGQSAVDHAGFPLDATGKQIPTTEVPAIRALLTREAVRDFVMGVETPHRGLRWLRVNAIPVTAAESSTVSVVTTFADVTEERRAIEQLRESERALRESEDRFRAAVDAMPDGLVVYSAIRDEDGAIVDFRCEFANRAAEEDQPLRGRGTASGGPSSRTRSTRMRARTSQRYANVVETGEPLVHEVPRYVNGEITGAYESQVVKLHDGFLSCFRNVTGRKRTEQALRASERRMFSFFTGLPVGVLVIDLADGPMFVNPRARELLGRGPVRHGTAEEMLDAYRMYRADTGDSYALEETPVYRAIQTRTTCTADDVLIKHEDNEITVTISATPIFEDDDRMSHIVVVVDDITERRAAGQQLARALTDLERSNEELAEFAAVAAHDLSEPLRVVGGFAELVRRRFGDRIDGEGNEWLDHVLAGVSRMRGLIDDLLAYSRAGSAPLAMRPVDLGDIVLSVRESLRIAIAEADAVVVVGQLPTVVGDATQLWQVLQNLLANALKFRQPDVTPEITVAATRVAAWMASQRDRQRDRCRGGRSRTDLRALPTAACTVRPAGERARSQHLPQDHRTPRRPRVGRGRARWRQPVLLHRRRRADLSSLARGAARAAGVRPGLPPCGPGCWRCRRSTHRRSSSRRHPWVRSPAHRSRDPRRRSTRRFRSRPFGRCWPR